MGRVWCLLKHYSSERGEKERILELGEGEADLFLAHNKHHEWLWEKWRNGQAVHSGNGSYVTNLFALSVPHRDE